MQLNCTFSDAISCWVASHSVNDEGSDADQFYIGTTISVNWDTILSVIAYRIQ